MEEATPKTNIKSITYDSQIRVLKVEFINGKKFQYLDVPEHLYNILMSLDFKDQFLNDEIRFGYLYQKIK